MVRHAHRREPTVPDRGIQATVTENKLPGLGVDFGRPLDDDVVKPNRLSAVRASPDTGGLADPPR